MKARFERMPRVLPLLAGAALLTVAASPALSYAGAQDGAEASVAIVDSDYQPGAITIPPGTRVVWTNTGGLLHDSVSLTGLWRSGRLEPGESYSRVFEEEGTYPYQCTIHWSMAGAVIVDAQAPPP